MPSRQLAGALLDVLELDGLLLEVALGGGETPAHVREGRRGAPSGEDGLGHPLPGLGEELARGGLGLSEAVEVPRLQAL